MVIFTTLFTTLSNAVKIDNENENAIWTLSNVVQINIEIDKIDLTLFNAINLNPTSYLKTLCINIDFLKINYFSSHGSPLQLFSTLNRKR